jgi:hypothetical protein
MRRPEHHDLGDDALVVACRAIAASRRTDEIWDLALAALRVHTAPSHVSIDRGSSPGHTTDPARAVRRAVQGHGLTFGSIVVEPTDPTDERRATVAATTDLVAMVTGAALGAADDGAPASAAGGEQPTTAGELGDRRRMDRDFIDQSRSGQVGFVVLRLFGLADDVAGDDPLVAEVGDVIAASIRQGDLAYASGRHEFGVLLPGATKPETTMVAERIRAAIVRHWASSSVAVTHPGLRVAGGVTAGRYEDPQRLAERAWSALEDASETGLDIVVTDLGV